MKLVRCDAEGFGLIAGEFLAAREAEHNVILGVHASTLSAGSDAYFAVVEREGQVAAAAMRTPPHGAVLSEGEAETVGLVVDDLAEVYGTLPGVLGPIGVAAAFAAAWNVWTGQPPRRAIRERIHRCAAVAEMARPNGAIRRASAGDESLAATWFDAFRAEAIPADMHHRSGREMAHDLVARPAPYGAFFWEVDGEAVSIAGCGSPTPNGARIGPVYTPPGWRGNGFATALVATLTQLLLETRQFCFLFTDLANPLSNAIYARIGYEPVSDVDQWVFGDR
jgi:predicted GNAT family acetyltransferase